MATAASQIIIKGYLDYAYLCSVIVHSMIELQISCRRSHYEHLIPGMLDTGFQPGAVVISGTDT